MTDTADKMSTLPPVETVQPNKSNESSHHQLHSTLLSSDQSLPKIITRPSINESANTQITFSNNINMSTASPYVKTFKPAITSTPLSKHYVFKTKTVPLVAKLFWRK